MKDFGLLTTLRGGHFSQHEDDCGAGAPFLNPFGARRPLT